MPATLQPVKPFTLRDVIMELTTPGGTTQFDFAKALDEVRFSPSQQMLSWAGLTPDAVFSEAGPETWTAVLVYAQDWETTNSLSRFLFDHAGKVAAARFVPRRSGASTAWNANLVLVAGDVGGKGGAFATSSVTCGVQGRPTPTAVTGA